MPKVPDKIPALDPAEHGIYRRIIDAAAQLREERREELKAQHVTRQVLNRLRMRADVADAGTEPEEWDEREKAQRRTRRWKSDG